MEKLKIIEVEPEAVVFDNGFRLFSNHNTDCCESHWLSFGDLALPDFDGLEFDLSGDEFFRRIEGYGIELIPVTGWPVKVPGYGSNNGYYSSDLELVLVDSDRKTIKQYDITECQKYEPE